MKSCSTATSGNYQLPRRPELTCCWNLHISYISFVHKQTIAVSHPKQPFNTPYSTKPKRFGGIWSVSVFLRHKANDANSLCTILKTLIYHVDFCPGCPPILSLQGELQLADSAVNERSYGRWTCFEKLWGLVACCHVVSTVEETASVILLYKLLYHLMTSCPFALLSCTPHNLNATHLPCGEFPLSHLFMRLSQKVGRPRRSLLTP